MGNPIKVGLRHVQLLVQAFLAMNFQACLDLGELRIKRYRG